MAYFNHVPGHPKVFIVRTASSRFTTAVREGLVANRCVPVRSIARRSIKRKASAKSQHSLGQELAQGTVLGSPGLGRSSKRPVQASREAAFRPLAQSPVAVECGQNLLRGVSDRVIIGPVRTTAASLVRVLAPSRTSGIRRVGNSEKSANSDVVARAGGSSRNGWKKESARKSLRPGASVH